MFWNAKYKNVANTKRLSYHAYTSISIIKSSYMRRNCDFIISQTACCWLSESVTERKLEMAAQFRIWTRCKSCASAELSVKCSQWSICSKVRNRLKSWINMSLLYPLNWNQKCILVKLSWNEISKNNFQNF